MDNLPIELIIHICNYIDNIEDLISIGCINSIYYRIIQKYKLKNQYKTQYLIRKACKDGKLYIIKYLHMTYPKRFMKIIQIDGWCLNFATEYDNEEIIYYLCKLKCYGMSLALINASKNGNYDICKYLYNYGIQINNKCLTGACQSGNLKTVKYYSNKGEIYQRNALKTATKYGHLNIIKFLINKGVACNFEIIDIAKLFNQQHIVRYLQNQGYNGSSNKKFKNNIKKYTIY